MPYRHLHRSPRGTRPLPPPQQPSHRARQLEVHLGEFPGHQRVQHALANNERHSDWLYDQQVAHTGGIVVGRITQAVPYVNWYRVALDGARGDIGCCYLMRQAALPMSTADADMLPPNTRVLVYVPHQAHYGMIMFAIPELVEDSNFVQPDWISQGSNCGFKREKYHHELLTLMQRRGGVMDFSSNRPMDQTCMGDFARFSHTGGGIFLDNFMNFMRIDETCGIWQFYLDRMLRICGYNMDVRTAMSERVVRNDQCEGHGYYGYNGYPWEVMGAWDSASAPHRTVADADVQYNEPFAKYEVNPATEDLQSFYRTEEYEGYCGQGFMRQVMLPPQGKKTGLNLYADEDPRIGVFREQIGYDGSYALQSAHSIYICKRVLIPVPKRIRLIEDEHAGDTASWDGTQNYRFADEKPAVETAPSHKVGNPAANDAFPHYQMACALSDLHAYTFNWKGLHPFVYHAKDYDVPQEAEIAPFTTLLAVPNFAALADNIALERPKPKQAWVDGRYGDTDYFETTAGISITPDGCIVIRDAYGAELRTGGGNIFWSCPGDFYVQTGRNFVVYGGSDCVLRARASVDITAALHDVRIKAEYNCDIVAGNNGNQGRLLLENQAASNSQDYINKFGEDVVGSGVIIKASHSQFVAMSAGIYLRTGSDAGKIESGDIVLDADQGQANIRTVSSSFNRFLNVQACDSFPANSNPETAYLWTADEAQIPAAVTIDGGVVICQDGLTVAGGVNVTGGHIATEDAAMYQGLVPSLTGIGLDDANAEVIQAQTDYEITNDAVVEDYTNNISTEFYADKRIGNASMQKNLAFAPRTAAQMDTTVWILPESYWQQLARLDDQALFAWTEPIIVYQGLDMMPHPGSEAWQGHTLMRMDFGYHTVKTGLDLGHGIGSDYETPRVNAWEAPATPNDSYRVINTTAT